MSNTIRRCGCGRSGGSGTPAGNPEFRFRTYHQQRQLNLRKLRLHRAIVFVACYQGGMNAPISLADLPPNQWTVIARRVERRDANGNYYDTFDFLVADGPDGVAMARDAGAVVTMHRHEPNGRVMLVAMPVPPKLRHRFAAPAGAYHMGPRGRVPPGGVGRGNVRRAGVGA